MRRQDLEKRFTTVRMVVLPDELGKTPSGGVREEAQEPRL